LLIPEIEVVLQEKFGILSPRIEPQAEVPATIGDLIKRSHLQRPELIERLSRTLDLCVDISVDWSMERIREFAADRQNLVLICDLEGKHPGLSLNSNVVTTAIRDWTSIYSLADSASEILCIGEDVKRAFSAALGFREKGYLKARYGLLPMSLKMTSIQK
jgi:hypothetical protein